MILRREVNSSYLLVQLKNCRDPRNLLGKRRELIILLFFVGLVFSLVPLNKHSLGSRLASSLDSAPFSMIDRHQNRKTKKYNDSFEKGVLH